MTTTDFDGGRFGLTASQADVLQYLHQHTRPGAVSPSYAEMADALGHRSKSTVYRIIEALERRGYIRRRVGCSRSIQIVGADDGRPMATDLFLAQLIDGGCGPYDVRAAVEAWLHGDWTTATGYLGTSGASND